MTVFTENALHLLKERYFYKYEDHQETEEEFFDRVSMGNPEYLKMLKDLDFLPNSPTLFNMGIEGSGTFSACFKFDVADTMNSPEGNGIMDVADKAAKVLKWGGGVGYALHVRPKGSPIKTTHGKALGPVGVLQIYHTIADQITQGGKRDGAQMGILHCDHKDLREFIHCKDDGVSLQTFNISVALTDEFMEAAIANPDCEQGVLLREMSESAWRTGDPGVFFIDTAERGNPTPHLGKLTGTNPCGEVPLLDNEACNLGSMNYGNFIVDGDINWDHLDRITVLAIQYLDEVLDENTFPQESITHIVNLTRKLGLGACGWADALALMHIEYASEEAVELARTVAKRVSRLALKTSLELAKEKGPAPCFDEDTYDLGSSPRNSTRTCIAPTGTIAILMDASSGIEPHFAITWNRTLGDGTVLEEQIPVLDRLNGFVPKTSLEIDWEWHVKHQAAWQEHTDLAVSKTINMRNEATAEDMLSAYIAMWESDCVGGTVYRDGSREVQVLSTKPQGSSSPRRLQLPNRRHANVRKVYVGGVKFFMTVGEYPDGTPGELFLNVSKRGSTEDGLFDIVGMLISWCLQWGVPLETLINSLMSTRFEPSGRTDDDEIPVASSIIDYVVRRMHRDYVEGDLTLDRTGMRCPSCGSDVKFEESCISCASGCGWSRC